MTKCWFCGEEMIWGSDCTKEEAGFGYDPEGIVSSLSCPNCNATADFYSGVEEED